MDDPTQFFDSPLSINPNTFRAGEDLSLSPRPFPRWTRNLPLIDVPFLEAFYRANQDTQDYVERVLTTGSGRLPSEHDEDDGEDDSDSDSESDLESDEDEDEDEDEWEVWIDPSESPPYNLEPSDEVLAEIASTAASPQERLQMLYNRANPFVKLSVEKILYDIDPECLPESDRIRRGEFKELVRSLGESCDDIQKRLDALQALLQERYGNADCAVSKL